MSTTFPRQLIDAARTQERIWSIARRITASYDGMAPAPECRHHAMWRRLSRLNRECQSLIDGIGYWNVKELRSIARHT